MKSLALKLLARLVRLAIVRPRPVAPPNAPTHRGAETGPPASVAMVRCDRCGFLAEQCEVMEFDGRKVCPWCRKGY